jgi:hypothetical protein
MEGLAEIIADFFNSIDPERTWSSPNNMYWRPLVPPKVL